MLGRLFRRAPPPEPLRLRLFTRPDCPLCEEMKAELARARTARPFVLEEVDVSRDPALEARHGLAVPVLEIAGRPAFKGRLTARDFERKFARRLRESSLPAADEARESRRDD